MSGLRDFCSSRSRSPKGQWDQHSTLQAKPVLLNRDESTGLGAMLSVWASAQLLIARAASGGVKYWRQSVAHTPGGRGLGSQFDSCYFRPLCTYQGLPLVASANCHTSGLLTTHGHYPSKNGAPAAVTGWVGSLWSCFDSMIVIGGRDPADPILAYFFRVLEWMPIMRGITANRRRRGSLNFRKI